MTHQTIHTDDAPRAIGPYSQATVWRDLVFCSGQIAIDPKSNQFASQAPLKEQAEQVMANLKEVLKASGSCFSHVLKTTIYLTTMEDFAVVNEIYQGFLTPPYPARATIAVKELPKKALVEIEVVAYKS